MPAPTTDGAVANIIATTRYLTTMTPRSTIGPTPDAQHRSRSQVEPEIGMATRREVIRCSGLQSAQSASRQRKHRELTAERRVVPQGGIDTDSTPAGGRIRQARGKTDTGPAADS